MKKRRSDMDKDIKLLDVVALTEDIGRRRWILFMELCRLW